MRGIPEEHQKSVVEALEQSKALVEMALEAETIVGVYETIRVASEKLYAVGTALGMMTPLLLRSGEFTLDEIKAESARVTALIKQFVELRVDFHKDHDGES